MKIVQKGNYNGDLIKTVLENRSVKDEYLFLNPDNSTDSDPAEFKNVPQGAKLLLDTLENKKQIEVLVDADADGFMSASLTFQYVKLLDNDANIGYILHDNKAHGLTDKVMKYLKESKPDLVIIPDAASNDTEQIDLLEDMGIKVLVIDHHQVEKERLSKKAIIINNQICENTNKNLVGVGVVYKFFQFIDEFVGMEEIDNFLDLVAVGQIGDSSDIADNEIRNLVLTGLDNVKNRFLKVAIGQKNGLGVELAPKDLSFGVIPLINAVARVGTAEERETLFKALSNIDTDKVFPTDKRKKNKTTGKFDIITFNFNIYEYAYELCSKAKSRQDTAVKKMVEHLDSSIVDDAGIIIAFTDNNDNPGITGLIANKIMGKYDKPVLLLNEQEETYTGSGRGHEKTLADFRKWCEESGLVEFAQGHDNAFGIAIKKDKIDDFKEYSRKIKKQETIYEVDILSDKPHKEHCEIVDRNKRLFGGAVSEPFIGIKGLTVPKRFISQRGSVLNIFSWGVSMVQFNSKPELFDELMEYPEDNVKIDVVGYYSVNEWSGQKKLQLIIKDIEAVYSNEENSDNNNEVTVDNIIF